MGRIISPVIKWIGSKRMQCEEIIQFFPNYISTYYEPFCGGCSIVHKMLTSQYIYRRYIGRIVCSDINGDLIDLWNTIKNDPRTLCNEYTRMWCEMYDIIDRRDKSKYYADIRDEFNQTRSPYLFFFLMRTCTNGLPRYNSYGNFNNSFHLTRDGMSPDTAQKIINSWSGVLKSNHVEFKRCDYNVIFNEVNDNDFLYLDPPYEITRSTGKYFGKIDYIDFFDRLRILNNRDIKFALSFDNEHGDIIVPGDCYTNKYNIKGSCGGFRRTFQNMNNENIYESLYLN